MLVILGTAYFNYTLLSFHTLKQSFGGILVGSPRLYEKASDSETIGRVNPVTPYVRSVRFRNNRTR